MTALSLIQPLPKDLNFPIFSLLNPIDLGRGCQVSKVWNLYCSSDELWIRFPELTAHWEKDIKKNVNLCGVGSYAAISNEFEKFTNKLKCEGMFQIRWEGHLQCVFPFDRDKKPYINLKVGYGNVDSLNMRPIDKCTLVFMKPFFSKQQNEVTLPSQIFISGQNSIFNPGHTYKHRNMMLIESDDSHDLSKRIDQITDECVKKLKTKANRRQKICSYSIFTIGSMTMALLTNYFLSPHFSSYYPGL